MRFNERQLINIGLEKPDFEGNLHYKRVQANGPNSKGFKEYWFRLKSNILFYYKLNSKRQLSSNQPYGLFVLEDSKVQYEGDSETPFAFSITFKDDYDKKHLFGARSETDVLQWINALKEASNFMEVNVPVGMSITLEDVIAKTKPSEKRKNISKKKPPKKAHGNPKRKLSKSSEDDSSSSKM